MRYNIFTVKEALEVFYVMGFENIQIDDFIHHFCKKYNLNQDREEQRIKHMLDTLKQKEKLKIKEGLIYMHNPLTANLKLVINDMEL